MNTVTKKSLLFISISVLMLNGCSTKNEVEVKPSTNFKSQGSWGKVTSTSNKEDCVDCYAAPMSSSTPPIANDNFHAKALKEVTQPNYQQVKVASLKSYGGYVYQEKVPDEINETDTYVTPSVTPINTSQGSYTPLGAAIQVGAFRNYSGAVSQVQKYNRLSDKYKVAIQTGTKNNKPLHRVRIVGFKNFVEAKKFMNRYALYEAFVVRK